MEVPLTTSKVQETLGAIEARKEYYLKKRQSMMDGTYDADKDPEARSHKSPSADAAATTSNGPTANGDISEEFEHVSCLLSCIERLCADLTALLACCFDKCMGLYSLRLARSPM